MAPETSAPITAAGRWPGLAGRALLVVVSTAASLLGAPTPVTAVLALAAAVLVTERVVRLRRRGPADAVGVGTGGLLVTLALLGLVLNYLPWGIDAASWSVGFAVLSLVALAACVGRDAAPVRWRPRGTSALNMVTLALAGAVLVAAVVLSVRSYDESRVTPLQLSAQGPVADGTVTVTLTSPEATGPLRLVAVSSAGTRVIDPDVGLAAGATITRAVDVSQGFRLSIRVQRPGQNTALRELIFDGGDLLPPTGS